MIFYIVRRIKWNLYTALAVDQKQKLFEASVHQGYWLHFATNLDWTTNQVVIKSWDTCFSLKDSYLSCRKDFPSKALQSFQFLLLIPTFAKFDIGVIYRFSQS